MYGWILYCCCNANVLCLFSYCNKIIKYNSILYVNKYECDRLCGIITAGFHLKCKTVWKTVVNIINSVTVVLKIPYLLNLIVKLNVFLMLRQTGFNPIVTIFFLHLYLCYSFYYRNKRHFHTISNKRNVCLLYLPNAFLNSA